MVEAEVETRGGTGHRGEPGQKLACHVEIARSERPARAISQQLAREHADAFCALDIQAFAYGLEAGSRCAVSMK